MPSHHIQRYKQYRNHMHISTENMFVMLLESSRMSHLCLYWFYPSFYVSFYLSHRTPMHQVIFLLTLYKLIRRITHLETTAALLRSYMLLISIKHELNLSIHLVLTVLYSDAVTLFTVCWSLHFELRRAGLCNEVATGCWSLQLEKTLHLFLL